MIIRNIENKDAESFFYMLKKLDSENKFMMYEPNERKTSIGEIISKIEDIHKSGSLTLVVEKNNKIIGFLSANRGFANRIKHSAYIVIGLLKDYTGMGIGTKLFKELDNWALGNDITRLELTVMVHNKNAVKLYKKMGFKIEGIKKKSLIIDEQYIDEYYMAKIF
ncbi:GNAT family N-acetyltransferase [Tepidibacter sp. Z1-5]|uniref:GNAT family N-acetyltransferase n=1 Tax=Tepidibacter sp. Z1-5 TaxID=3134138 RepID=UPI0030C5DADE